MSLPKHNQVLITARNAEGIEACLKFKSKDDWIPIDAKHGKMIKHFLPTQVCTIQFGSPAGWSFGDWEGNP